MISEAEPSLMSSEVNKSPTLPLSISAEESKPKVEGKIPNGKLNHTKDENGRIVHNHPRDQDNYKRELLAQCTCDHSKEHEVEESSEHLLCESVRRVHIEPQLQEEIKEVDGISYTIYESEKQMPDIMRLITKDLSEPYSIYTYRYFIHNWPKLCFLAMDKEKCVGAIVCKLDMHKKMVRRGYIAMLAVDADYRRKKIGSRLVLKAIRGMIADDCDEVVLETEITNKAALRLYENLGFVRDKRLFRYYLNGVDALRLKLWLR
ncbi:N-alpha-acetyltransferase 30-like [Saccostrea cucullata]|uniref:N-alpha-acetyltransferase 30-like n=1 Tax=Saccostrea cuccullata TaxID=36930 RepID=UPI002ED4EE4C